MNLLLRLCFVRYCSREAVNPMKENFVENTKRISRYFDRSSIVDRIEIRLDFALPCTIAADYTILKQLIAGELQK